MSQGEAEEEDGLEGLDLPIGHGDEHWLEQVALIVLKVACFRVRSSGR